MKGSREDFSLLIVYHWQPVFLVGMVRTALTNVVQTVTVVTDSMGNVSLDASLDGKEVTVKMVQKDNLNAYKFDKKYNKRIVYIKSLWYTLKYQLLHNQTNDLLKASCKNTKNRKKSIYNLPIWKFLFIIIYIFLLFNWKICLCMKA